MKGVRKNKSIELMLKELIKFQFWSRATRADIRVLC